MVDNQHKKITGYRDLTEEEIDNMNAVKLSSATLEKLITSVAAIPGVDQRWVAIAQTDLQKGIMSLVRAIARPAKFSRRK